MTRRVVATDYGGPEVLGLLEATEAHRYLQAGHARGKVVLIP